MAFQKNSLYQSIELLRRRPITIAIEVRCYLRSPPIISQMIKKIHNGHKMGHTIHKIIYTQIIGTISYLLILGYVITLLLLYKTDKLLLVFLSILGKNCNVFCYLNTKTSKMREDQVKKHRLFLLQDQDL